MLSPDDLEADEINEGQTLIIASLLAKMHSINLHSEGLGESEFDIHNSKRITDLIRDSTQM